MATTDPVILDGKALAAKIRSRLAQEVEAGLANGMRKPGLAVILAGDDAASQIYVRNKQKACEETGIISRPFFMPASTSQNELRSLITHLNHDPSIDGILLQLPLAEKLNAEECIEAIDPAKDVDGFHPLNMGRLALDLPGFIPCTPAGVMELLDAYGFSLHGKKAVIVGRSNIVGKPLALLLARKNVNATVTLCHSHTQDLEKECLTADFLFAAMGRPRAITGNMLREGCVVVDIGINRTNQGLCGDVDAESVKGKAAAITPVPGGIGPMTIAMLMRNTLQAWKKNLCQAC